MSTPEGKVKAKVKKLLENYPSIYQFWPVQTGMGAKTLDCLLCIGGYFVSVETKRPGGEPTDLQWTTIEDMQRAGGVCLVIDGDAGVQRLKELIEKISHASTRQPAPQDVGCPGQLGDQEPVSYRPRDHIGWIRTLVPLARPN